MDFLSPGEEIEELPQDIIAVDWPTSIYRNSVSAVFVNQAGQSVRAPLVDFSLTIRSDLEVVDAVVIEAKHDDLSYFFTFSFETNLFFQPLTDLEPQISVEHDRSLISFVHYINEQMLIFYTSDLSLIDGYSLFRSPEEHLPPFDDNAIEVIDWAANGVNIQREFGDAGAGMQSIHTYLETSLGNSDDNVVYYDHGTGEIADFISFKATNDRILISLYHCKGSRAEYSGHRLDSMSELTAQVVKSVTWSSKARILTNIRRRFTQNIGSHRFVRGSLDELEALLPPATPASIDYEFIAVQPGLRKEGLTIELSNGLAAASDHLTRANYKPLRVLSS